MNAPQSKGTRTARGLRELPGFDVTVETVIGRVTMDSIGQPGGYDSEVEAAFGCIGKIVHSDGPETATYRFPSAHGGVVAVSVRHDKDAET